MRCFICSFWGVFIMCFCCKALPFNKIGCTREYKTKLRIYFDIPLVCTTFAAVECVFAYRCLFPYLQHICSTLTQMACLITVCISRKKYESKYINIQKMNQHISISDKLCKSLNVNIYDHFRVVTKMVAFDSESKY